MLTVFWLGHHCVHTHQNHESVTLVLNMPSNKPLKMEELKALKFVDAHLVIVEQVVSSVKIFTTAISMTVLLAFLDHAKSARVKMLSPVS